MITEKELKPFCPTSRQEWRQWLQQHHVSEQSVWLVYHKKKANKPGVTYAEAVEEALCFGWIDSKAVPIDEHTYQQFFSKRKKNSVWSKVNKERIERLIEQGLMTKAGFDVIEAAKHNGFWATLDEVEQLTIPADLEQAFENQPAAASYFLGLCRSDRRNILQWLVLAKRHETRQNRIAEILQKAVENQKPKPFSRNNKGV